MWLICPSMTRSSPDYDCIEESEKKDYQELFSAFESFITKENVSFKVVDEIEVQETPLLTNYVILFQYLKCIPDNKQFRDCAKLVKTKRSLKYLKVDEII